MSNIHAKQVNNSENAVNTRITEFVCVRDYAIGLVWHPDWGIFPNLFCDRCHVVRRRINARYVEQKTWGKETSHRWIRLLITSHEYQRYVNPDAASIQLWRSPDCHAAPILNLFAFPGTNRNAAVVTRIPG